MSRQQAFGVVVRGLGLYVIWNGCGFLFALTAPQEPDIGWSYLIQFIGHAIFGLVLLFEADNFVKLFYRDKESSSKADSPPEDQPPS